MAADPYRYFRVEARELLEQLSKGALDLERGAGAPDLVARLLRLTHTLKGAARVVKQREIADRAHAIEGALNPFRESAANVPRECIDLVLELVDGIGAGVAALTLPIDADAVAGSKAIPGETFQTVRADIAEMDALLDGIGEAHGQMRALRRGLASVERAHSLADLLAGQRNVGSALDQMDRELSQVRSVAEQLRLIPAGMLFTPLERAARDTAQALGKHVVFAGSGGDIRLDAHLLGVLQSALLQIVRNSVAHGVEPAEIRRTAGKPVEGRVTLEVARRGRQIVFSCTDDGMGVDLEGVRRAAQRKGLPAARVRELDAGALLRLLLRGGISTSAAVTEESGRGIGLDLVREAVEQLGGEVGVRTEAGKATTVELVVPLSIASLEAIVVESSGTASLIPLDAVRRTLRLNAGDIARTAHGDSVVHDGKVIPFAPLSRLLRQAGTTRDNRAWSTVIVQGASGVAAFGVDRMLGAASIVFRPLPEIARSAAVIAGASLDAEGNPQLVLDCDSLVAGAQRLGASAVEPAVRGAPILIVDDSLTTRMLEQSILESAGFEVDVAASAEEGLEVARKLPHALFLVDVEMPGMDGFTFVERTRADPDLRGTPAIMVTSRDYPEDRQRAKDVGAQGYIVKGEFDQTDFLDQVRRLTA